MKYWSIFNSYRIVIIVLLSFCCGLFFGRFGRDYLYFVEESSELTAASTSGSQFPRMHKILCWVLTTPANLHLRSIYIKQTWAKRCDKTLFMSTKANATFPAIGLNISDRIAESKHIDSTKTKTAWLYVHKNYIDDYDYFVRTDDDTFLIVENLRKLLAWRDPEAAEFYGRIFKTQNRGIIYAAGGASLVLSRKSLRLLRQELDDYRCLDRGRGDDWKTGQ